MRTVKAILRAAVEGGPLTQAEAGVCVELEARSYAEGHKVSHSEAVRTVLLDGSLPAQITSIYLGRKVTAPKSRGLPARVKEYSLFDLLSQRVTAHCREYGLNPENEKGFLAGLHAVLANDPVLKRFLRQKLLGEEVAALKKDYGLRP